MIPNFAKIVDSIRRMTVRDDDNPEELRARIVKLIEQIQAEGDHPITHVARNFIYRRFEDMSPDGFLTVLVQDDGDVILGITTEDGSVCVEFCTEMMGGGKSPRVRECLLELILAIKEDEAKYSQDYKRKHIERSADGHQHSECD